jgi:hypothetical protein
LISLAIQHSIATGWVTLNTPSQHYHSLNKHLCWKNIHSYRHCRHFQNWQMLYGVWIVLYGVCIVLYGVWIVLYDVRIVLYSVCIVLYGVRIVLYGVCIMLYGVWIVLYGVWIVLSLLLDWILTPAPTASKSSGH